MSFVLDPEVPGGAFDGFVGDAGAASAAQRVWTPRTGRCPRCTSATGRRPLFDDAAGCDQLFGWAQSLPEAARPS